MKLVRRGANTHLLCDRHLRPGDLVLSNVTYAASCETCGELTLADRYEEMLQSEQRLRNNMERFATLVGAARSS